MVTAVQKFLIFPPKNLEKIRAPKIRMRRFFLKKNFLKLLFLSTDMHFVLVVYLLIIQVLSL